MISNLCAFNSVVLINLKVYLAAKVEIEVVLTYVLMGIAVLSFMIFRI